MSSILTNTSAMVALETLRGINKNLGQVQSEIATGKKVSNAKDNAAVFAISTVMKADVASFDQISDTLNLGSATVGVARAASEQVTELLTEMKTLIVSAQEDNVDRTKIQTDVAALRDQVSSIVGAAQFNGQNLLQGGGSINVLSSLDRAADGTVTASNINVSRSSLETSALTLGAGSTIAGATSVAVSGATIAGGASGTMTFTAGSTSAGDSYSFTVGADTINYVARENDTLNDVVSGIKTAIDAANITGVTVDITQVADPTSTNSVVTINNASGAPTLNLAILGQTEDGTAGGGLGDIAGFNVSTSAGAADALSKIDAMLQVAVDAASNFGSSQKRIEIQGEFVNSLMDSMKAGISALVDADLEEASARLQSLQVQQQLGVQALSIANQAPQSILSLFR
ncbi:MAG: flagellin [Robiginitomaculum sp.]|nr:MAG: flagellin [Robiginitomaculum sp.]